MDGTSGSLEDAELPKLLNNLESSDWVPVSVGSENDIHNQLTLALVHVLEEFNIEGLNCTLQMLETLASPL